MIQFRKENINRKKRPVMEFKNNIGNYLYFLLKGGDYVIKRSL